ncbi:recombination protein NinB [Pseudorhodoplanes sp.]|uniref:recombination protein NinB n=1 Tax=Pseudorhodoplanes sp. TaxID=1934341 RepID=UPI002C427887|nr:recombination protein NinB [Pseudorhodoplanes sp.]HWV44073.1 recombination protein NinB [Pseudorhodoplanes sp.]
MSRALVVCRTDADRQRAASWALKAPDGTRIEFKAVKRTMAQNDRMWSMLTDVARQVRWHGQKLTADEWKLIFLDGLDRETRTVPSLDGRGVVSLGRSSSDLTRQEISDLMELIAAFGARRGVKFKVFAE